MENDDISCTLASKADQLDAVDLVTGPITGKVISVDIVDDKQPVHIHLDCWHVPFKPCLTMRRIISICWGTKRSQWLGKSMSLYCDPFVKFGKETPGGVRISHLSDISETKTINLTITRGRTAPFVVQPLKVETRAEEYPAEMFEANLPKWAQLIADGKMSASAVILKASERAPLTDAQKERIVAAEEETE